MSQQEFVPRQQQSENEDEIVAPQYPYSWSGNLNSEAVPRDEPPSSYEYDAPMQQGYQAQDGQISEASEYEYTQPAPQPIAPQNNPYSNDGDAYEQGYRPYSGYNAQQNSPGQGVPPWARPQAQPRRPFRFGAILFVLIMISLLQGLFTHGFWFRGGFEFILGGIFLPIFILMLLATWISRAMWGGRSGWRRRGPWGW